ncbi:MAG: hypothetical protein GXP42_04890 [Chloroflexi bacterium]|nr:hypothetical protein [Chloroflexota bacterium]
MNERKPRQAPSAYERVIPIVLVILVILTALVGIIAVAVLFGWWPE